MIPFSYNKTTENSHILIYLFYKIYTVRFYQCNSSFVIFPSFKNVWKDFIIFRHNIRFMFRFYTLYTYNDGFDSINKNSCTCSIPIEPVQNRVAMVALNFRILIPPSIVVEKFRKLNISTLKLAHKRLYQKFIIAMEAIKIISFDDLGNTKSVCLIANQYQFEIENFPN